jgi:hypothetical protein
MKHLLIKKSTDKKQEEIEKLIYAYEDGGICLGVNTGNTLPTNCRGMEIWSR